MANDPRLAFGLALEWSVMHRDKKKTNSGNPPIPTYRKCSEHGRQIEEVWPVAKRRLGPVLRSYRKCTCSGGGAAHAYMFAEGSAWP